MHRQTSSRSPKPRAERRSSRRRANRPTWAMWSFRFRALKAHLRKAGGHPVASELTLLVVHGVLHLLGHDHAGVREKRKMWTAQADILRELGVHIKINAA